MRFDPHIRFEHPPAPHDTVTARYNGQRIGTIGVRFKGQAGTLERCFDDYDRLVCSKLSLRLKFDEYEPSYGSSATCTRRSGPPKPTPCTIGDA